MAEGINFNSESLDDDAESDKDKKKKKKATKDVGATIVGGVIESPKNTEKPKPNLFEQLRGLLSDVAPEKATVKIADAHDVENLKTVASPDEEAAIARAAELLTAESLPPAERPTDFPDFRTELHADELSSGEGVIELHPATAEPSSEADAFTQSVEADLALIEPVASPEEEAAKQRAPKVLAKASSGMRGGTRRSRAHTGTTSGQGSTPVGFTGGAGSSNGSGSGNLPQGANPNSTPGGQGGNVIPSNPNSPVTLLAQRLALETAHSVGRAKGRVEGLIAGAIIGGGAEHVRHKRHEKKMERQTKEAFARRDQKIETLEYGHQQLKTDQLEMARKAEADKRQIRQAAQAEMARTVGEQMALARSENAAALEAAKRAAELKETERKKAETIERLNAQAMEQERQEAEKLRGPENRLETSAWHTMEVDKHGHVVEDSNIEYGHEYYRERSHETAPVDQLDTKAGAAAVAGLVGGAAASSPSSSTQDVPSWAPLPVAQPVSATGASDKTDATEAASVDIVSLIPWLVLLLAIGIILWIVV